MEGRPLVLVVDDDEDCRVLALKILELLDYSYVSASSGEKVVELSQLYQPSLVLLDIALPHTDGIEIVQRLKTDPTTATIPVVAVTARAMVGDRERGLSAGFDNYLTKPYGLDELTQIVEAYAACSLSRSLSY
ncbi:response regulator [Leptolyngbya sp. FACHB-261]|uniref:response regulator n=1 Tax=Leptolyngbya sp. FACHB-261 TaxID=2692806 RepID=UPI001688934B|nr:response regulator [Leptolyngbya sp. FACHB-261]MBD2100059.1 response regulator [Leptolyngbya sp. FACHB-261]